MEIRFGMDAQTVKVLCRDKMKGTWRVVTGLLVFWLAVLLYMSATLYNSSDVNERTERQLAKALQELDLLRTQNDELAQLAGDLKDIQKMLSVKDVNSQKNLEDKLDQANKKLGQLTNSFVGKVRPVVESEDGGPPVPDFNGDALSPGTEHEHLRRKVENGIREMWYYVRSRMKNTLNADSVIMDEAADHYRTILTDMNNLSLANGHGDWRSREAKELSEIVQNRLHYLQNPKDCSTAKKLVCNMNKGCGYGCQLHHVAYCFIMAYATKRTLILESTGWRYSPLGWEKVFQPLSETCLDRSGANTHGWADGDKMDTYQVITVPIVDSLSPRPKFLPQAIPKDLAPRLMRLHGHPFVWWIGQFLKYLLRPSSDLQAEILASQRTLHFQSPIVGIHVRRTDKVGTEAAFHGIEEYMVHAEDFYKQLAMKQTVKVKRVYLATDDPNLLKEAKLKYPEYLFISDNGFSQSAGLSVRYTETSLRGIILDIHFLSLCDHLVCTFSSQVCRVAYEIMQTMHPDATTRFTSLDDIYYFGGQQGHSQVALQSHVAKNTDQINLDVGNLVGIAGNHWNGYSKGKNHKSGKSGLYPSYKMAESIRVAEFPSYAEADLLLKKGNR